MNMNLHTKRVCVVLELKKRLTSNILQIEYEYTKPNKEINYENKRIKQTTHT